ncbi:Fic family protein [Candidatus Woesearchaeota archaeon]|nr:Fic family protein [Candidatus Woesearchaeota archaeon]
MPTKYDVFARIIEKAPCKPKDLQFQAEIYNHLSALENRRWIKKEKGIITPLKTTQTIAAAKIIKYCLKSGLNYNHFFSRNLPLAIRSLVDNAPRLRPSNLRNNKDFVELLKYLEQHQFILIRKRKPRTGTVLEHQIFKYVASFHGEKISVRETIKKNKEITKNILNGKNTPINPFDKRVFSFLAGSAQLEGSTITEGETVNLILKDIYPEKPQKDVQMVKNLHASLKYLLDNLQEDITPKRIKKINEQIMFSLHSNAGNYKKTHNKIQGNPSFKTAGPVEVPLLMEQFCEYLHTIDNKEKCIENIGKIHNELQRIHPFSDGNSRTTRTIINWMLIKHDLPLLVLKMGAFDTYMSLTKLSKDRNDEKLTAFIQAAILHEKLIN